MLLIAGPLRKKKIGTFFFQRSNDHKARGARPLIEEFFCAASLMTEIFNFLNFGKKQQQKKQKIRSFQN